MKKFLAFSAAVAIVASLQANVIDWSLPNLTDGSNNPVSYTLDDIVFIPTAAPTTYNAGVVNGTPSSGSNTLIDSDDGYMAGTWTDNLSDATTYYMAYAGADGKYYAIDNGGAAYTVTVDPTTANPLVPGSGQGEALLGDSGATSVSTVAAAVPEPTTAVLALAGVAMLIRRRKA